MAMRWRTEKGARENKHLRRIAKYLYKYAKRHGLTYVDIYVLSSDDSCALSARTKAYEQTVSSEYAFAPIIHDPTKEVEE